MRADVASRSGSVASPVVGGDLGAQGAERLAGPTGRGAGSRAAGPSSSSRSVAQPRALDVEAGPVVEAFVSSAAMTPVSQ